MCLVYEIPHKRWAYLKIISAVPKRPLSLWHEEDQSEVVWGAGTASTFNRKGQGGPLVLSCYLIFLLLPCFMILQYCPCTIFQMTDFSYLGCIVSCVAACWIRISASINLRGLLYIFSCFGLKELLSTHWMFCPTACPQLLIELSIWLEGHQH